MKQHINFPSIDQFRNVVSSINRQHNFVGLDENGEAIYDHTKPKPTLAFTGTVKLHGTNAGVVFNNVDGLWAQSRSNIITPQQDNAAFAFFVETNKEVFERLIKNVAVKNNVDLDNNSIAIFGEWVGKGIQKGVAISELEQKSLFVFGAKVVPFVKDVEDKPISYWVDYSYIESPEHRIYNINNYVVYNVEVDFNYPELSQNKLAELTLEVEKECPVAKEFGYSGIGEGIVWSCNVNGTVHRFKTKGDKHSSSKVKTIASIDTDKVSSAKDFVEYAVTESRFNQALENVFPNNEPIDTKKLGDVMRWVVNDIIKEESDTLAKNNLEPKDVNKHISNKVREMFFKLQTT